MVSMSDAEIEAHARAICDEAHQLIKRAMAERGVHFDHAVLIVAVDHKRGKVMCSESYEGQQEPSHLYRTLAESHERHPERIDREIFVIS